MPIYVGCYTNSGNAFGVSRLTPLVVDGLIESTMTILEDAKTKVAEADAQPVNSPEDWWAMVMGSGYRGTVAQLSPQDQERVRAENMEFIRQAAVQSLEANVVYAVAVKT